jgi:hypothetical protein
MGSFAQLRELVLCTPSSQPPVVAYRIFRGPKVAPVVMWGLSKGCFVQLGEQKRVATAATLGLPS